ncbi:Nuclear transport factor 2 [Spironucleus salmonicida]|uniref:Nuclear transport factor 2 n=1 Tax=Spironucleus salmonicida TaxID=348837 RepID=V6LXL7_9EUKA|nr:Nuclear transport factor 2 [Spironucleus salmonicida]|eukprot:EST48461.1 Nuclear transport factor 2 [Spironucleus salmonicida]
MADVQQLAQQFTQFFYQTFSVRANRNQLVTMYAPTAQLNYNGRTYNGQEGANTLFMNNFQLGDMQVNPIQVSSVSAAGGALVSTYCEFQEASGMKGTFCQSFILLPDATGNITIGGDIFAVNM